MSHFLQIVYLKVLAAQSVIQHIKMQENQKLNFENIYIYGTTGLYKPNSFPSFIITI